MSRDNGGPMTADIARLKELLEKATPIPNLAGFLITRDGVVISDRGYLAHPGPRIMSQYDRNGYRCITVGANKKRYMVHRLVALTFIGPAPEGMQVRHLNGNPSDNHLDNLAWGTISDNAQDRKLHGTERAKENGRRGAVKISGERSHLSKLTEKDVRSIRARTNAGERPSNVAKDYPGISPFTVYNIAQRRTWKNVD